MEEKFENFRWRFKTIGGLHNHDYWWKNIFVSYHLKWEDWWDDYCEGLHNLVGSSHEDGSHNRRFFGSIFGLEGEKLFLKWLYYGKKKDLLPFYEWFRNYMEQKKIEREREILKEKQLETQKQRKKEKNRGFIYLLKSRNLYKIGKTKRPEERIKIYKTENPFEIKVVFQKEVGDYDRIENKLIKRFKDKQVRGEWFRLNKDDIKWIQQNL